MPERCPACGSVLADDARRSRRCAACGHDLTAPPPPPNWIVGERDLRRVAARQRSLLWLVLVLVAVNLASPFLANATGSPVVGLVMLVVSLVIQLIALVVIIQLMAALRFSVAARILCAILIFAPCISIVVLLIINGRATRALHQTGLKVGLLGVSDETVVTFLGVNRCRSCGYSLVGNRTGTCPECGATSASAVEPG